MEEEGRLWRQCAAWLVACRVLPPSHRAVQDDSQVFELAQVLRDGVLLCQLLNNVEPGSLPLKEINLRPQMSQFLCLRNIRMFINTCVNRFGMHHAELFDPFDLFEVRDFAKVINALSKLSYSAVVQKKGIGGFPSQDLEDDEDIYHSLEEMADEYDLDEEDDIYDLPGDEECDELYEDIMKSEVMRPILPPGQMRDEDRRNCCLNEISETERRYTDTLETIEKHFMQPLKRLLTSKDIDAIFSNMEELLRLHRSFCTEIQHNILQRGGQNLHQIFINYKEKFVLYGLYCSKMTDASAYIDTLTAREEYRQKIEECSHRANQGRHSLRDLLVFPMQRVLKYPLLLKELLTFTTNATERENLKRALDAMKDVGQYVNEVKRDMETLKTITKMQNSIENLNQALSMYGRPKIDDELKVLSVTERRSKQDRNIFLFDLAVIICKRRGDTFEMKEILDLKEYKVTDDPTPNKDNKKWSFGFFLAHLHGQNGFQFHCKTVEQKKKWMEQFEMAQSNIKPEKWNGQNHEFEMHTFDRCTECRSCHMLLRGVFFQGYHCLRCGASAHKECLGNMDACRQPRLTDSPLNTMDKNFNGPRSAAASPIPDLGLPKMSAISGYFGIPSPPAAYLPALTFEKNEIIELMRGDPKSNWWQGRSVVSGKVGYFPCTFVEPVRPKKVENHDYGGYPWFAEVLERSAAGDILMSCPHGTYLVRGRVRDQREYAISIRHNEEVKHIKIVAKEGKFHITETKRFKSLVQLVEYYQVHSLKEGFSALDTNLKYPYKGSMQSVLPLRRMRGPADKPQPIGVGIARYDYVARDRAELSFREGDVVKIYSKGVNGWWKGESCGRFGLFPFSYVEEEML
ncbi:guanine nucleotide exchange factor VAV3-like [Lethenteron reissneri]|uniref:guanine nucleotide exchange factor VAV3-like n=1 Tax=Lethenteron reissneri TaxID=7753 RepID=UPI002AB62147|nr:guanine nucleotide exchange factor VAV3-like [Lethenteron reissneri]